MRIIILLDRFIDDTGWLMTFKAKTANKLRYFIAHTIKSIFIANNSKNRCNRQI